MKSVSVSLSIQSVSMSNPISFILQILSIHLYFVYSLSTFIWFLVNFISTTVVLVLSFISLLSFHSDIKESVMPGHYKFVFPRVSTVLMV